MSNDRRRAQLLEAYERDQPALTVELARLYLAEEPEDRSVLIIYGEALADMARHAEAHAAFEHALKLSAAGNGASVLRLLGRLYDARGELGEAERYYREAIADAPQHASAYIYLGAMLARMGRLDEAQALHLQATSCVDGAVDQAYLNLGLVQRARGDYLGALESLRHALTLDPTDSTAQDALLDLEAVLFQFPEA